MGRLRDLLTKFIKYTPPRDLMAPICTHPNLREKEHYTKLVVNAHDHCRTCEEKMCLVCSELHVQQHCILDLRVNKEMGEGTLADFNYGHMMKLPLEDIKCICGTPLGPQPNHTICAACGVATCSKECHDEWERMGNCTYHDNYYEKPEDVHMRSILLTNVRNIQKAGIREWNPASKSALSYIAAYAKAGADYIYLQRGYRNYGIPQPQLVAKMTKVDFGLDFTTNQERVCTCDCEVCLDRGHHSVGNCEFSCLKMADANSEKYRDDPEMFQECGCDCPFCRGGIVVSRHSKLDCMLYCYKSTYNLDKLV